MARYRCPSSSLEVSRSHAQAAQRLSRMTLRSNGESSKAPKRSNLCRPDDNMKRRRSGIDLTKKKEIEMAKKKEVLRQQLKTRDFSFVFVGNIEPTIDESVLYNNFIHCGKITRIQIRCSRGCAVTIGRAISSATRTPRDRQYATIEFVNQNSVRNALKLDGLVLHGARLVVSLSAGDLPEVRDVVMRRVNKFRKQLGERRTRPQHPGRITSQKTEPVLDGGVGRNATRFPKPDKNKFMGVSFAKCLM